METCTKCGSGITERFARVFGDNQDRVHGCPECSSIAEVLDGKAAGADE